MLQWRSPKGRPDNVLGTSWINLPGTSLELRLGRFIHVISRRYQNVRSGRPRVGQIGSLGDVLGTLEGDVFGNNICQLRSQPFDNKSCYWKENLILTNPELFLIYWTCHHLFWFRFLRLLLIFYCQSSWQEVSILKKQFLIRPGVSKTKF